MYEDWELIEMYKRAKNKKAQIKILCQLSCRSEDYIINMLTQAGFSVAADKRKRQYDGAWTDEEINTLISMKRSGESQSSIARTLNKTCDAVRGKISYLRMYSKEDI